MDVIWDFLIFFVAHWVLLIPQGFGSYYYVFYILLCTKHLHLDVFVSLQRTHRVYCVRLAQVLVDDYCSMVPGSVPTLHNIHSASPRFCCQFITAVTTLYDLSTGV